VTGGKKNWGSGKTFYSGENAAKDTSDNFQINHGSTSNSYVINVYLKQYGYDEEKTQCVKVAGAHKTSKNHWKADGTYASWVKLNFTATCSDTGGSGCKKGTYNIEVLENKKTGKAEMLDNAGNKDICTVKVDRDDILPDCDGYTVANQYTWATSKTAYGYCRWDNVAC
ncbi:MAG: hypothetical protein RSC93_14620, partial [Erysipelotrichaceae bacterium]